ncbi:hypothetical protein BD626DRAFT_32198 [Schizophyllum amplum]|uniref:Secreted protein n=1 Tax=Schizophyllum amplum TaxID=97359 RepID=A0A550CE39_9AGAR|nr:hypothetical protein BD626DRAFT_32198 [Auriculariopsis ampla]
MERQLTCSFVGALMMSLLLSRGRHRPKTYVWGTRVVEFCMVQYGTASMPAVRGRKGVAHTSDEEGALSMGHTWIQIAGRSTLQRSDASSSSYLRVRASMPKITGAEVAASLVVKEQCPATARST